MLRDNPLFRPSSADCLDIFYILTGDSNESEEEDDSEDDDPEDEEEDESVSV